MNLVYVEAEKNIKNVAEDRFYLRWKFKKRVYKKFRKTVFKEI